MTATIFWEPVSSRPEKTLSTMAPSFFKDTLAKALRSLPDSFNEADIPVLRGMAAVHGDMEHNPYLEMIEAIEAHGEIMVWSEH